MRLLFATAKSSLAISSVSGVTQQSPVVGGQPRSILRIGSEIIVRTRTALDTQHRVLRVGQYFEVETGKPVIVDGRMLMPVGTPGVGEVTNIRRHRIWGKAGRFEVRILFLRTGDRLIRLMGMADDAANACGTGAIGMSAVISLPAGIFATAARARLPAGTVIQAFVDEDVPIAIAPNSAPPIVARLVAAPILPAPPRRAD